MLATGFAAIIIGMPFFDLIAVQSPHLRKHLLHHLGHVATASHDIEELLDIFLEAASGRSTQWSDTGAHEKSNCDTASNNLNLINTPRFQKWISSAFVIQCLQPQEPG